MLWHFLWLFILFALQVLTLDLVLFAVQVHYREDFEKNKGKGFSVVADTPELQRIKKTQDQISNVSSSRVPTPLLVQSNKNLIKHQRRWISKGLFEGRAVSRLCHKTNLVQNWSFFNWLLFYDYFNNNILSLHPKHVSWTLCEGIFVAHDLIHLIQRAAMRLIMGYTIITLQTSIVCPSTISFPDQEQIL